MIIGHGIDLQDMQAIEKAMTKRASFAKKVLTEKEYEVYSSFQGRRQLQYLAGRWSAKEAYTKALGTGVGRIGFQDIEILNDEKGAPYVSKSPLSAKAWVSISHSGNFVQASVILEEEDES